MHLLLDRIVEIDPLEVQVGELIPECGGKGGDLLLDLFFRQPGGRRSQWRWLPVSIRMQLLSLAQGIGNPFKHDL